MTKKQILIEAINNGINDKNELLKLTGYTKGSLASAMTLYINKPKSVNIIAIAKQQITTAHKVTFSINKRFSFMEKAVKMVVKGVQNSLFIAGDGGLGKTYTVTKKMEELDANYKMIAGYATASGLYRALHDNPESLIVFDDCDSVLEDKNAINILKAATDTKEKRIVSYNAKMKDYKTSFEFKGQIIFISNLTIDKLPQALQSRSTVIDLAMSVNDKIDRIESVLPNINEATLEMRKLALEFIKKNADRISDINFRTLIKVAKIFVECEDDMEEAKEMALFLVQG